MIDPLTEKDFKLYRGYGSSESGKFVIYQKSGIKIEVNSYNDIEELKQRILKNQEDAELCSKLVKILSNHCGEEGDNEGAVETLERLIKIIERLKKRVLFYDEEVKRLDLTKGMSAEEHTWRALHSILDGDNKE